MKRHREWIISCEQHIANLDKKPDHVKQSSDKVEFGIDGSFRQLAVDWTILRCQAIVSFNTLFIYWQLILSYFIRWFCWHLINFIEFVNFSIIIYHFHNENTSLSNRAHLNVLYFQPKNSKADSAINTHQIKTLI